MRRKFNGPLENIFIPQMDTVNRDTFPFSSSRPKSECSPVRERYLNKLIINIQRRTCVNKKKKTHGPFPRNVSLFIISHFIYRQAKRVNRVEAGQLSRTRARIITRAKLIDSMLLHECDSIKIAPNERKLTF